MPEYGLPSVENKFTFYVSNHVSKPEKLHALQEHRVAEATGGAGREQRVSAALVM